jgi:hypothetical protein
MAEYTTSQFLRSPSQRKEQPQAKRKKCAGWKQLPHPTDHLLVTVHFTDHRIQKFCPSCIRAASTDESLSDKDRRIVETAHELSAVFNPFVA